MTKKEIVKTISEECGLTQLKTKEIVQRTFEAIIDTLVAEGRIELRNFGVFEVKKRAARKARNPRSGDRVDVPEKFVVTFKPGKEMEERVLNLEEESAKAALSEQKPETATIAPPAAPQQSSPVPPPPTPESQAPAVGSPNPSVPPTPNTPPTQFPPPGGQP
ncbi:MAG: integration host factor subunit beta [Planctomicrobium sp.]|nr:integration host factor subunit beta [Planctomicrobium sp.]